MNMVSHASSGGGDQRDFKATAPKDAAAHTGQHGTAGSPVMGIGLRAGQFLRGQRVARRILGDLMEPDKVEHVDRRIAWQ